MLTAVLSLSLLLVLSGCSSEASGEDEKQNQEEVVQEKANDEIAEDQVEQEQEEQAETINEEEMTEEVEKKWVTIQLDGLPQIEAPTEAPVYPGNQSYQLTFEQDMDRASVEAALMENFTPSGNEITREEKDKIDAYKQDATFTFHWTSDSALLFSVDYTISEEQYFLMYDVNVSGAKTKSGDQVLEAPTLEVVLDPYDEQLWKIAVDGSKVEQVSSWDELYQPNQIIDDQYVTLIRPRVSICCHDQVPNVHYVYDMINDEMYEYPHEYNYFDDVMTNYVGFAPFYADKRGFFYEKGNEQFVLEDPMQQQVEINTEGYVHGAIFSKAKQHVILVVGETEEDVSDLDLVIYSLEDDTVVSIQEALIGQVPLGVAHSYKYPVPIVDNGNKVYITMMEQESYNSLNYEYDWKSSEVLFKTLPSQVDLVDVVINESDDGQYQIYGEEIYEGAKKLVEKPYAKHWIKDSHKVAYLQWLDDSSVNVVVYDVDQDKEEVLINMEYGWRTDIVGVTGDWIYVGTTQELSK